LTPLGDLDAVKPSSGNRIVDVVALPKVIPPGLEGLARLISKPTSQQRD